MYDRLLNLFKSQSFFLFGARGVGKSTYLKQTFDLNSTFTIDLLDSDLFLRLATQPALLIDIAKKQHSLGKEWIVIDEVQRIPELLNVVHKLIEDEKYKFALSGSSARKLKRGGANLLAGRAFVFHMFPLLSSELGGDFDMGQALSYGTLPRVVTFTDEAEKNLALKSYVDTYLKEEIVSEQLIRNIPPFRQFISIAAQTNSLIVNYSNIARDLSNSAENVKRYFQILEDTLVGTFLYPLERSVRRQQSKAPKFYLFDTGVIRALTGSIDAKLQESSYEYGRLFETFIIHEISRRFEYLKKSVKLSYLRTKDDAEIDLIIERAGETPVLVEIKSSRTVHESDLKHLMSLGAAFGDAKKICLSRDPIERIISGVSVLPWDAGLREIGI